MLRVVCQSHITCKQKLIPEISFVVIKAPVLGQFLIGHSDLIQSLHSHGELTLLASCVCKRV